MIYKSDPFLLVVVLGVEGSRGLGFRVQGLGFRVSGLDLLLLVVVLGGEGSRGIANFDNSL